MVHQHVFFSPKPEQRDWLRCCEQQGHPWIDSERLSYNPADVRRHLIHPVFVSEFSSWVVSPFRLCPFRVAAFKALGRHSVSGAMTCARTTAATDIDHVSHCFVEISCPKGRWNQISGLWFFATPKNDGVSSSVGVIFHSQYDGKVIAFHGSKPPTNWWYTWL